MLVFIPTVGAQDAYLENHPGYFDFSSFEAFAVEGKSVDVSLDESLIGFMAATVEEKSAEAAEALKQIKRIAVRVFEIEDKDSREIKDQAAAMEQQLLRENWRKVVRVNEDDESVFVFMKYSGTLIEGLAVIVIELGDEAVFVNLVGEIDPKTLGTLMKNAELFKEAGLEDFLDDMDMDLD